MEENPINNQKIELTPLQKMRREFEGASFLTGGRGLLAYGEFLGINFSEMKGKSVLEIGSGAYEKFKKEATRIGIKVFSSSVHLNEARPSFYGRAQEMPFGDNVFDYELALFSVPYYLDSKEEVEITVSEVIRTLKPHGRAYFSPVLPGKKVILDDILKKFSDSISYNFFPLPKSLTKLLREKTAYRLVVTKKDK